MPPTKLAHLVYQTNRMPEMRDWYCAVLGARVIYENKHLSFATYDDEHHRVAFLDFGPLAPRDPNATELGVKPVEQPGLHHVAFTFGSMGEFPDNYVRLRDYIEHPDLVAQRIGRYARLVGRENVIAGTDCGFGTWVGQAAVDPGIVWAKMASLAEGARRASGEFW